MSFLRCSLIAVALILVAWIAAISIQAARLPKGSLVSHFAEMTIKPFLYEDFLNRADTVMRSSGLARFGATTELNQLYGRSVLYANYRGQVTQRSFFITIDDLKGVGKIEVRVYETYFEDERTRMDALAKVEAFVKQYGGNLLRAS